MTRDEHIEMSKAKARERIASARQLIERIENHHMRLYEQNGSEPMRDVTDERLADQRQAIEQEEELLRLYEADHA